MKPPNTGPNVGVSNVTKVYRLIDKPLSSGVHRSLRIPVPITVGALLLPAVSKCWAPTQYTKSKRTFHQDQQGTAAQSTGSPSSQSRKLC